MSVLFIYCVVYIFKRIPECIDRVRRKKINSSKTLIQKANKSITTNITKRKMYKIDRYRHFIHYASGGGHSVARRILHFYCEIENQFAK